MTTIPKLTFTTAAVLIVLGIGLNAAFTPASHRSKVESVVRSMAKDPSSVRFGHVMEFTHAGKPVVCGHMVAKNSFGIAGNVAFIAVGDDVRVLERSPVVAYEVVGQQKGPLERCFM